MFLQGWQELWADIELGRLQELKQLALGNMVIRVPLITQAGRTITIVKLRLIVKETDSEYPVIHLFLLRKMQ